MGSVEIPLEMLRGYHKGFMIVDEKAAHLGLNGGLAAQAGEATARASLAAQEAGKRLGKEATQAVDKGSHALGKMIGQTKRATQASLAATEKSSKEKKASHTRTSDKKSSGKAARAVGRQLGKVGSMFGSFADEYKKSSK